MAAPVPAAGPEAPRSQVDLFIDATLKREGLQPNPPAPLGVLRRRATFLATGLPPGPDLPELDGASDPADAYTRLIDRLLSSPAFGERWAKHWLDAAGYADSNGYFNADTDRPLAYRYRDYVVRSINQDKPFDRFLREQIAGDELSGWEPGEPVTADIIDQLVATHFLRNGQDGSGESDGNPDEVRADRYYALESSVQILGSSLLGLTVQCAKCHDHKFEPFTQRDYYALQAFLYPAFHIEKWTKPNDRVIHAPLPGEHEAWVASEKALDTTEREARGGFNEWARLRQPKGRVLFEDDFEAPGPLAHRWSALAPGDDAPGGSPAVALDQDGAPAARIREGRLVLIEGGGSGDRWLCTQRTFDWFPSIVGAWIQVGFDLVDDRIGKDDAHAERVGYFIAAHDFNDNGAVPGGNILIDGNPGGPSAVDVDYPGPDTRHPGRIGATGYKPGRRYGVRVIRLEGDACHLQHLVDDVPDGEPLKLTRADLPRGAFGFEYCCGRSFIVDNVRVEASNEADPAWAAANKQFLEELAGRRNGLDSQLKEIRKRRSPEPGRIAWTTDSGPVPPPVPLLKRGDHKKPGDPVPAAFPSWLNPSGRLPAPRPTARTTGLRTSLADWLVEPGSPQAFQVARVTVNRIWQHYFGTGLVATTDNLGRSGATPSHPELLDWLARDFIGSGWRMKSIHRRILLSRAFRQSSQPDTRAVGLDPANRWLWRFPVRRLDAESIRDAVLWSSGCLHPKSGGPYVPTPRNGNGEVFPDPSHPEAGARTLYLQARRTQVPTFLGNFDAPSIVFNCTRRPQTTMPLQSLALLNSDFAVESGAALARLVVSQEQGREARFELAFQRVCNRRPSPAESRAGMEFLRAQQAAYAGRPDPERAAWNDLCHSLYLLNAFLYLE